MAYYNQPEHQLYRPLQVNTLDLLPDIMGGTWEDLLPDIGFMVLDKLHEVVERIRFGAVCKQWYEISKENLKVVKPCRKVLPMLLVPSPESPAKQDRPCLYAVSCLGKYYSKLQLQVPFNSERYWGSCNGWIAIQNDDRTLTLINPFGRDVASIHLPGVKNLMRPTHCSWVYNVFLSPNSTPDDYTVVAIHSGMYELATIKSGEDSWTWVPRRPETAPASLFSNVVFYQGGVYASTETSMIVKVDIHARPPKVKILCPLNRRKPQFIKTYLVESTSSELFYLQRCYNPRQDPPTERVTIGFNIFKLKLHGGKADLIDQKDFKTLNGDAFFVGDNMPVAIKAHGCQANSIYFTDDIHDPGYYKPSGPVDIGCYNVEDETISHVYSSNPAHKEGVARPIWISPMQHGS